MQSIIFCIIFRLDTSINQNVNLKFTSHPASILMHKFSVLGGTLFRYCPVYFNLQPKLGNTIYNTFLHTQQHHSLNAGRTLNTVLLLCRH